jgi:predicted metal-dependent peptidase
MTAIDTSGSIDDQMLELIDAELRLLSRSYAITVVECDAVIRRVYRYRGLKSVLGRGGTDFRPPLQSSFLRKHQPDILIYFTDGAGPAPDDPPRTPVIWCIVPDGQPPVEWGRTIQISSQ